MISADFVADGEDEPFASAVFEQPPAIGDRVWIQEALHGPHRTVEVVARTWNAMLYRRSPNDLVTLWVRDIEKD